jgi:hypothetical protein
LLPLGIGIAIGLAIIGAIFAYIQVHSPKTQDLHEMRTLQK